MRGDRLKVLRTNKGYTQSELAEFLGTSQTQIRRWESNEVVPSSESLRAVAEFFDVTADYLLGMVDTPQGKILESDLTDDEQELIHFLRSGLMTEAFKALAAITEHQKDKHGS